MRCIQPVPKTNALAWVRQFPEYQTGHLSLSLSLSHVSLSLSSMHFRGPISCQNLRCNCHRNLGISTRSDFTLPWAHAVGLGRSSLEIEKVKNIFSMLLPLYKTSISFMLATYKFPLYLLHDVTYKFYNRLQLGMYNSQFGFFLKFHRVRGNS